MVLDLILLNHLNQKMAAFAGNGHRSLATVVKGRDFVKIGALVKVLPKS